MFLLKRSVLGVVIELDFRGGIPLRVSSIAILVILLRLELIQASVVPLPLALTAQSRVSCGVRCLDRRRLPGASRTSSLSVHFDGRLVESVRSVQPPLLYGCT